jgi:putative chitinase
MDITALLKWLWQLLFPASPPEAIPQPPPKSILPDTTFIATGPEVIVIEERIKPLHEVIAHALRYTLSEEQIKSIRAIEEAMKEYGIEDLRHQAYIIATAWHESKLRPIVEKRARRGTELRRLQDRYWGSGYYGRGFVQLTWQKNYEKFAKLLKTDLIANPDWALNTQVAAQILVFGMRDGLFTRRCLDDYFFHQSEDWINARRIVNALDKAGVIADTAIQIYNHIKKEDV